MCTARNLEPPTSKIWNFGLTPMSILWTLWPLHPGSKAGDPYIHFDHLDEGFILLHLNLCFNLILILPQLLLCISIEIMCECSTMTFMACKTHTHANTLLHAYLSPLVLKAHHHRFWVPFDLSQQWWLYPSPLAHYPAVLPLTRNKKNMPAAALLLRSPPRVLCKLRAHAPLPHLPLHGHPRIGPPCFHPVRLCGGPQAPHTYGGSYTSCGR